jgi:hypothetical protein
MSSQGTRRATGALSWDQKNLDPVIQRYVKRYLFDEGFIEALGILDPRLDRGITELLKGLNERVDWVICMARPAWHVRDTSFAVSANFRSCELASALMPFITN